MTIKELKNILRYYDEEAEAEGDYYDPNTLYIKADVNASKEYEKKITETY